VIDDPFQGRKELMNSHRQGATSKSPTQTEKGNVLTLSVLNIFYILFPVLNMYILAFAA